MECTLIAGLKCDEQCDASVSVVGEVVRNVTQDDKICEVEDGNGCFITFKYFYSDAHELFIYADNEKICYNGYNSELLPTVEMPK